MNYIDEIIETVDGSCQTKRYRLLQELGAGSFSKCWKVTPVGTDKIYAMKMVQKKNIKGLEQQKLLSQIKIHQSLSHPHIVFLQHSFEDEEHQYIFLEYCSNGTLDQRCPKYMQTDEKDIRYYGLQIISALKYLHQKRILHRDLKLSNCFINSQDKIKIGDFGFACKLQCEQQLKRQTCGTPNFLSPEVAGGFGHSFPSDIWSFGVILFRMKYGVCPFQSESLQQTVRRIKTLEYSFEKWITISNELEDLIQKILQVDYDSRPTIEQIENHPFFGGSIQNNLLKKSNSLTGFFQRFFSRQKREANPSLHKTDSCRNLKQMKTILRQKTQQKLESQKNILREDNRIGTITNLSKLTTMNTTKGVTPRITEISMAYFGKMNETKITKRSIKCRNMQPLITQYHPNFVISNIEIYDECIIVYLTNGLRQIIKDRETYIVFTNGHCVDRQGTVIKDIPRLIDYMCRQRLKQPACKLTEEAFKDQIHKKNFVTKWKTVSGQKLFSMCAATILTTQLRNIYYIKSEFCQCLYNNKLEIVNNEALLTKYKNMLLEVHAAQAPTNRLKKFLE